MKRIFLLCSFIPAAAGLLIVSILAVQLFENQSDYSAFVPMGLIALSLLIAFVFKPGMGYIFFLLALPFQNEDYAVLKISSAVIRPCDLIALPVFIGWLLSAWFVNNQDKAFRKTGIELPLLAFSTFVIASTWWSTSFMTSVSKVAQLIYALLLFYMSIDLINTRKRLHAVLWAWVVAGTLLAGTTIFEALGAAGRASSVLSPNSLVTGEILNYHIFIGIGLFLVQRSFWSRTAALLLTGGCAIALIATGSRGPILGFAGGMIFLFVVSPSFRKLMKYIPSLMAIGVLIFVSWCITLGAYPLAEFNDALIRFIQIMQDPMSDLGVRFRVTLWSAGLELFTRFPIVGIGVGSLGDRMFEHVPVILGHTEVLHFMYLEMLILFGCFGFLLFALLFVRMIKVLFRVRKDLSDPFLNEGLNGITAALVAQAVGWLTYGKFIENRVFWVCFALVFVVSRLGSNDQGSFSEGSSIRRTPGT